MQGVIFKLSNFWLDNENKLLPKIILKLCFKFFDFYRYDFERDDHGITKKNILTLFKSKLTPFSKLIIEHSFSEDILCDLKNSLQYDDISFLIIHNNNRDFSPYFLKTFANKIDWFLFASNNYFDEHALNKYILPMGCYFYNNFKVKITIVRKYKNNMDWKCLSQNRRMSTKELYEFQNKIIWNIACKYQKNIDTYLIKKYKNNMDWAWLSQYRLMAIEELYEFQNEIIWNVACKYQDNINTYLIKKYKNKMNWRWLSRNRTMSIEELYEFQNEIIWERASFQRNLDDFLVKKYINQINFEIYARYHVFSIDIFRAFTESVGFYLIDKGVLTLMLIYKCTANLNDIISEFHEYLDFEIVSSEPIVLNKKIYNKFINKFNWNEISLNHRLTLDLIKTFKQYLSHKYLSRNDLILYNNKKYE